MQLRNSHVEETHKVRYGCVSWSFHASPGMLPSQHFDALTNSEAPQWTFLSWVWDDPFSGPEDSAVLNCSVPCPHYPVSQLCAHCFLVCVGFLCSLQEVTRASPPLWSMRWSSPPPSAFRAVACTLFHLSATSQGEIVCILWTWELLKEMTVIFIFMTLVLGPRKIVGKYNFF